MRKQVGFGVISENVGTGESGVPKQVLSARIQREYPYEDGWEVMSASAPQVAAGTLYIVVFLAQYKDVPETKASAK